jgi:hypothetical protein
MIVNNRKFRWDPYVMIKNPEFEAFWTSHLKDKKKILFILGKGFDCRMNLAIEKIAALKSDSLIDCLLIEFEEGKNSSSHKYKEDVDKNLAELKKIIPTVSSKAIKLWDGSGRKKRRIGSRQASENIICDFNDLKEYSEIIVDISSLPRGIYFSLIGKILYLLDTHDKKQERNFFIIVAENAAIDFEIKESGIDDDLDYLKGFGGRLDLSEDTPIIWLPILGEDKKSHIEKAFNFIDPDELCPILPFPAKNPRRGDKMIIDYHQLLFEEMRVEPQNIMYVSEQNPFDVYRKLCSTIIHYKQSMQTLGDCRAALTSFSSKLLSIGTLLTAYELNHPTDDSEKIGVGVVNVDSSGYEIEDINSLNNLKNESELFVIWLSGDPYND